MDIAMTFIQSKGSQSILKIYVQPGASKNEIVGMYGEPPRLKIKIKAPPQDGEANSEVISFLAKTLDLPKSRIQFIRGEASRQKDLLIDVSIEILQMHFKTL